MGGKILSVQISPPDVTQKRNLTEIFFEALQRCNSRRKEFREPAVMSPLTWPQGLIWGTKITFPPPTPEIATFGSSKLLHLEQQPGRQRGFLAG